MKTKDGTYVDRVTRPEENDTMEWAKQRKWFFLYNCTLDENLAWATCEIKDDTGATYNYERYDAPVAPVTPPETEESTEE